MESPWRRANLQKFQIRNLLEARIRELRGRAVGDAFQQALFGDDAASRVAVTDQYAFEFHAQAYAPSAITTAVSDLSTSASTTMVASGTLIARRNSNVPAGWTFRLRRVVSSTGCAISSGVKGVLSFCKRPTDVSTRIFCVSCPVQQMLPAPYWLSNIKARIAGLPQKMTG